MTRRITENSEQRQDQTKIVRTAVDSSWLEPNVATCCALLSSFSFMFGMKQYAPNIHIQTNPYCVHINHR